MKIKFQTGVLKQGGALIVRHLLTSMAITVFGLVAFWWFLEQAFWKQLFSIICTAIYFVMMMSRAQRIAERDRHGWSEEKAYPLKGFVLAVAPVLTTFILWAIYFFTWNCLTIDNSVYGLPGILYNVIFTVWTFPFGGITGLYQGYMMWYGHILIYAVPAFAVILGYWLGYKKIRLEDRLDSMMYEKEK